MTLAAGKQVTATLGGVSSTGTDLTFQLSADKLTAGYYVTATGRRTAAGGEYRAKIKITSPGSVTLSLTRFVGGTETTSRPRKVSGLTYTAGMPLRVRLQVFGTSPTTVRAKVWAGRRPGAVGLAAVRHGHDGGPAGGGQHRADDVPDRLRDQRSDRRPLQRPDGRRRSVTLAPSGPSATERPRQARGSVSRAAGRPDVVLTTLAASRVTSTSIVFADSYREATASSMEVPRRAMSTPLAWWTTGAARLVARRTSAVGSSTS